MSQEAKDSMFIGAALLLAIAEPRRGQLACSRESLCSVPLDRCTLQFAAVMLPVLLQDGLDRRDTLCTGKTVIPGLRLNPSQPICQCTIDSRTDFSRNQADELGTVLIP